MRTRPWSAGLPSGQPRRRLLFVLAVAARADILVYPPPGKTKGAIFSASPRPTSAVRRAALGVSAGTAEAGAPHNLARGRNAARVCTLHTPLGDRLQFRAQVERAKPYVYSQPHATTHDPQTIANLKATPTPEPHMSVFARAAPLLGRKETPGATPTNSRRWDRPALRVRRPFRLLPICTPS